MTGNITSKPPIWFWIIGAIALIWNAFGCWHYIANAYEMEAATKDLTEAQISFMDSMPAWYTALFAIAVFFGFLASIMLLLRKKMAINLFVISFLAATINQIYWLFGSDAPEIFSDHSPYLMPIIIVVLGLIFIWASKKSRVNGWIS